MSVMVTTPSNGLPDTADHPAGPPFPAPNGKLMRLPAAPEQRILAVKFRSPDGRYWNAIGGGATVAAAIIYALESCPDDTFWTPLTGTICMASRNGQGPPAAAGGVIVPITGGEAILRREKREISILVARKEVTITHARYSAGEQVAGPHVHHEHTDAFYVLEGELTFEIGREAETITVSAGGFVAAPPEVAHSFRNDSDRHARWLTIHAHDGGFAAFMRGLRDGVEVEWDISAVSAGGGRPATDAIVQS